MSCGRYLGETRPGQAVKAIPGQGSHVPITLLGSSLFSAQLAAKLGLPFAFAAHFAPQYLCAAAALYHEQFQPGEMLDKPYMMVGVQVIAAETDAAARRLFTTPQQRFLRLIRNQPVELLPPVDSMDGLWTEWERAAVESKLGAAIVGSNATVKAGLEKLVRDTGASEVIVVTDTYTHEDRLESYRRVAEIAKRGNPERFRPAQVAWVPAGPSWQFQGWKSRLARREHSVNFIQNRAPWWPAHTGVT